MDAETMNKILLGLMGTGGAIYAGFKFFGNTWTSRIGRSDQKEDLLIKTLQESNEKLERKVEALEMKQEEMQKEITKLREDRAELHTLLKQVVLIADELDVEDKYNFSELIKE